MSTLKNNIIAITIGIRYNRSFRIPDISGDIIDNILYSNKTPFSTKFFPNFQENSNLEKTIFNRDTSEYLRINTDDLILAVKVDNDFDNKFNWLRNSVLPYFSNELFKNYKIQNIRRFGVIFSHKIERNNKLSDIVTTMTENNVCDADNVSISFSKKAPSTDALFRKGVNDYTNRIYNFQELKESVHADLDYQYYYEPAIEDLRECFAEKIMDSANIFLTDKYYNWLNKYEKK